MYFFFIAWMMHGEKRKLSPIKETSKKINRNTMSDHMNDRMFFGFVMKHEQKITNFFFLFFSFSSLFRLLNKQGEKKKKKTTSNHRIKQSRICK